MKGETVEIKGMAGIWEIMDKFKSGTGTCYVIVNTETDVVKTCSPFNITKLA